MGMTLHGTQDREPLGGDLDPALPKDTGRVGEHVVRLGRSLDRVKSWTGQERTKSEAAGALKCCAGWSSGFRDEAVLRSRSCFMSFVEPLTGSEK